VGTEKALRSLRGHTRKGCQPGKGWQTAKAATPCHALTPYQKQGMATPPEVAPGARPSPPRPPIALYTRARI